MELKREIEREREKEERKGHRERGGVERERERGGKSSVYICLSRLGDCVHIDNVH